MSVSDHQLQRSLQRVTFGVVRDMQQALEANAANRLAEGTQQFQIPISGTATSEILWTTQEIDFTYSFYNATGQRDNPNTEPQIYYGVKIDSASPVAVQCCVMEWQRKDADEIEGATIAAGVYAPGDTVDFRGMLHLSFQGYGAPKEFDPSDLE